MTISKEHLKEVYLKSVKKIAMDEHFYAVQNAKNYVISTYGRLFRLLDNEHHKIVKIQYQHGEEGYMILYDNATKEKRISVSRLISNVFFPYEQVFRLYNPYCSDYAKRWKVENLIIIRTKEEYANILYAKINGENIPPEKHLFAGRWNLPKGETVNNALKVLYRNMKTRATNTNYKKRYPQYKESTMSQEWINNPSAFKTYWMDRIYYYPDKLTLDKDIMGFGNTNHYGAGLVIPIPASINNIFARGSSKLGYSIEESTKDGIKGYKVPQSVYVITGEKEEDRFCETYEEALNVGRKRKADYIRKVVAKERKQGYIPDYILVVMERWAELCEAGKIKIWEPEIRKSEGDKSNELS